MIQLSVNGIKLEAPFTQETPFQELLSYLKNHLIPEQTLISSLRVNGKEITEDEEVQIATTPFSELQSVEVFTAHPREVAEETLQGLLQFTGILETLCLRTAKQSDQPRFYTEFSKLIDGISTLTEGISVVKKVLRLDNDSVPVLDALEDDLLSILKDLLTQQEKKKASAIAAILQERLIENIQIWREVAIPTLIRARDC